jgi:hypothetical protein
MDFSKRLFYLDLTIRRCVRDLEKAKGVKKQYEKEVHTLLGILGGLCKPKLLVPNVYTALLDTLDNWLFHEVTQIKQFAVDEATFPIEAVYFDKERWLNEPLDSKAAAFEATRRLTIRDVSLLLPVFAEYEMLLAKLRNKWERLVDNGQPAREALKARLRRVLRRVERRCLKGMKVLVECGQHDVDHKIETFVRGS